MLSFAVMMGGLTLVKVGYDTCLKSIVPLSGNLFFAVCRSWMWPRCSVSGEPTATMISALLAGLVAGYGIAIPVGAVATYLITLGAAHGFPTAAAGGLGVASVDAIYAALAVLLGAVLAPMITVIGTPLRWLSALVLIGVAARMLWSGLRSRPDGEAPPDAPSPRRAYATVFAITLVNPATMVYFAALVTGSSIAFTDPGQAVVFVLAAGVASASWQLLLACAGAGLGRVLSGPAARRWTAVVGALVVLALAVRTLLA